MDCSCTPPPKYIEDVRKLYESSGSLDDFCDRYNTAYAGKHSVWHEEDTIFFSYPRCLCDCVQCINETLSKTWCLCTLGYTKKLFDYVLNCDTGIELKEFNTVAFVTITRVMFFFKEKDYHVWK